MKSVRSCALYSSEHSDAEDDGGVEETAAGGGQHAIRRLTNSNIPRQNHYHQKYSEDI